MYTKNYFEIAHQFLSKKCYQKAVPYLFEAAQEGHPLAHLWIEDIYAHGLDAVEALASRKKQLSLYPLRLSKLQRAEIDWIRAR